MTEFRVPKAIDLKEGDKKVFVVKNTKILLINDAGRLIATQPKCPHAGGPLDKGAVCSGRLICPWHMGTFDLSTGALVEPPAMEGLKTYPVRVEDQNVFVDLAPQSSKGQRKAGTHKVRDKRTFLLAGGGAASAMATVTLRDEGYRGKIVVVDPVEEEPLDRTQLSKEALSGEVRLANTHLKVFDKNSVMRIKASIISISSKRRQVRLDNGRAIRFDCALIATGGIPKRLNIPGADRVFTIRHSEDVRKVRAKATKGSHAVVIGTSFIGLESASALTQRGVHVTVVGEEELPFARQFGDRVARSLLTLHEKKGVKFLLGATVISVFNQNVMVAKDGNKRIIPADFVLMGVGVTPNLQFEHDLPMAEGGGIQVDESLRARDRVWVAGDIATVGQSRIEHWRLAQQHGMTAARQMMGDRTGFHGVPFFWTSHFGKQFNYLGHAAEWDKIVYQGNVKEFEFLAFYIVGGRVSAILSCGKDKETALWSEMMRSHPTMKHVNSWLRGQG